MRAHVLDVAPQPTAVVGVTTTWDAFPALWPRLLEEVYEVVRPRPELAPEPGPRGAAGAAAHGLALGGPHWEIYGHPPEVEIEICWLVR